MQMMHEEERDSADWWSLVVGVGLQKQIQVASGCGGGKRLPLCILSDYQDRLPLVSTTQDEACLLIVYQGCVRKLLMQPAMDLWIRIVCIKC